MCGKFYGKAVTTISLIRNEITSTLISGTFWPSLFRIFCLPVSHLKKLYLVYKGAIFSLFLKRT